MCVICVLYMYIQQKPAGDTPASAPWLKLLGLRIREKAMRGDFLRDFAGDCATKAAVEKSCDSYHEMGVSENSVPPNPMVNDHYPY